MLVGPDPYYKKIVPGFESESFLFESFTNLGGPINEA